MHNIEHWDYPQNANKRTVANEIDEYVAHEDWKEGCSGLYNGIRWLDGNIYDSYDEAMDALEKLDRGNYDNLAVLYKSYAHVKRTKKMEALQERMFQVQEAKRVLDNKSVKELSARKSQYLGCKNCGSKLATKYIKNSKCPLCGAELRSDTVMARLNAMSDKFSALLKECKAEEKKAKNKAETRWLVKFEYHT